ncbi:MAG: type II secretion system protein [Kiritimatiellae bacterium]|jgi:prepilin-type N-terminal cleavage/methylation domain-containing protein|nr:type II secretion system protein [Kiritimatiellia bacterium]
MSVVFKKFDDRSAFTLVELMIVLVVIGILMASVFKLFSAVSANAEKATTNSRLERMRNAISGFYSSYGTYPPVPVCFSSDPLNAEMDKGSGGGIDLPWSGSDDEKANAAYWACRSQPVAFEYPYAQEYDAVINKKYGSINGANGVFGNAASYDSYEWQDIKMFKFGLMSFLLPRPTLVGLPAANESWSDEQPISGFYRSGQWTHYNTTSRIGVNGTDEELQNALEGQDAQERREVAKWLPNLEGIVSGYTPDADDMMHISLASDHWIKKFPLSIDSTGEDDNYIGDYDHNGGLTILHITTVVDGWSEEFFYYSAPPYQSYRIWSAGPDRKTFPPWVPIETLSSADQKLVSEWIKDDIVGFAR